MVGAGDSMAHGGAGFQLAKMHPKIAGRGQRVPSDAEKSAHARNVGTAFLEER